MQIIEQFGSPFVGGILIGLSASMLLLLKGRVFGVSGIVAGALYPKKGDTAWRVAALAGLVAAGLLSSFLEPELLVGSTTGAFGRYILAGLLVGFGTQLGSGCTSGHGVCGMSRMSPRSLVATITFISVGILVVLCEITFSGVFLCTSFWPWACYLWNDAASEGIGIFRYLWSMGPESYCSDGRSYSGSLCFLSAYYQAAKSHACDPFSNTNPSRY
jgi:uncharacterized membrane protein YedE/YeeE